MDVKHVGLVLRRLPGLWVTLIICLVLPVAMACSKKEAPPPPPPEVQVAEVVQKDVPIYIELVGSTLGSEDVEIRARVEGYLVSILFTEGSFVRKGQPLYKIDSKPFEAALPIRRRPTWQLRERVSKKPTMMSYGISLWPSKKR